MVTVDTNIWCLGHEEKYFVKEHSDSKNEYSEDDIIKMLVFLADNIFVVLTENSSSRQLAFQWVRIAPFFSSTSFYIVIRSGVHTVYALNGKETSRVNLTYRYIDVVLFINNPEFENYLGQKYPFELDNKDTTESTTSASYLDLLLSIERDGQLHTSIYDKLDDFNFHIKTFRF